MSKLTTTLAVTVFSTWLAVTIMSQHPNRVFDYFRKYDTIGVLIFCIERCDMMKVSARGVRQPFFPHVALSTHYGTHTAGQKRPCLTSVLK
jgi:hypothetical protein